ncbi:MAG: NAD+ synthase [Sulfuriferula sp.]|nr:NAD+ synthase [Sulfuriferula sp.]
MKIALAQINAIVGDIAGNAGKIIDAATVAKLAGASIVLTPELSLSGYPPEDLLLRDDLYEQIERELKRLLAYSHGITLIVGHPAKQGKQRYNAASVIRDGMVIGTYHKQSLPNHTVFDEERYFTPGTAACIFEQDGIRFGVNICADIWHVEAPRCAAEAHAEVLLVLNASPYHLGKLNERYAVIRDRIQETDVAMLYCNLVGGQDELVFDGGSFAMDANGHLTNQFPCFTEAVYYVELDGVSPVKADIEPAATTEASVYQALVLGLQDYVQKNRFPGVLLGLSGGIDSALTLAIAVDALGADKVHAVMMPSEFTADISVTDARKMAETLGVEYSELPIRPLFDQFVSSLAPLFADRPFDLTEENIQARVRGTLLMALSNKFGSLVITTGNKSEMAVGYATLYGDMAGGFAVLRDVSKTLVYRLSNFRNCLSPVIPQRIIDRPPSAELRQDQTDQDTLPEYAILDAIIERYVEQDESVAKIIAAGFNADEVRRVVRMIDRSEYKRRQAPVGTRVTSRAFGKDRRYPITSRFNSNEENSR